MSAPVATSARSAFVRTLLSCLALVGAFEVGARAFGWFDPTVLPDPYQGFPGTPPLYRPERQPDGGLRYVRSPNKDKYRVEGFPYDKGPDEFRVFCIGSSSTNSDAFIEPDGSYPHFLESYLRHLLPGRTPVVVNAGGGGSSSVQHLEVLREVLDYQPDLVVVAPEAGDKNLIPPSPQGVMTQRDDANPISTWLRSRLTRSRLYLAARELLAAVQPPSARPRNAPSVFSAFFLYTLSQPFSRQTFSRLFEFKSDRVPVLMPFAIPREEVDYAHRRFSERLQRMVDLARDRGVPLVFVGPQRNLKASFYLRFHIDPGEIRDGRVDEWRALYERGLEAKRAGRLEDAVELLRQVRGLYLLDRDEILAFYLGECLEQLGRRAEALEEYIKPYRENPSLQIIRDAASRNGVPYADPFPRVCAESRDGTPGYAEFTDSVHPMPGTNRIVALSVLDAMRETGAWPELLDDASPRFSAADRAVSAAVARCLPPPHTRMLSAILEGRTAEAVEFGRSMTEDELYLGYNALYYGWALTLAGDEQAARIVYVNLRRRLLRRDSEVPALETDEDLIRVAYGGDVFAWF
jgi:tetratricopeptide (TPR) repeat protein